MMGESPPSNHVGWLMGATPPDGNGFLASPPLGGSVGRHASGSSGGMHLMGASVPLPKFQHPSHSLLEDGGFKQIRYVKYYKRCIDDRAAKGARALGGAARCATARRRASALGLAGAAAAPASGGSARPLPPKPAPKSACCAAAMPATRPRLEAPCSKLTKQPAPLPNLLPQESARARR
jgi:hypothetical protein